MNLLFAIALSIAVSTSYAFRPVNFKSSLVLKNTASNTILHAATSTSTTTSTEAKFFPEFLMADEKDDKNKYGLEWFNEQLAEAQKDDKPKPPPLYEPGPFTQRLLAAAIYFIPLIDAMDLGKYLFAAYPEIAVVFNSGLGVFASIYNGVPFLPFAIFFLLSYVARAPNVPVEIRFHASQAFLIALVQVIPSLSFPFLEKAMVPFMNVLYNTGKI
jgi:hypothetical protein